MTTGGKFKKRVRERMTRTGENYTAARQALIEERHGDGHAVEDLDRQLGEEAERKEGEKHR